MGDPLSRSHAASTISTLCDRCAHEILSTQLGASLLPKFMLLLGPSAAELSTQDQAFLRDSIVSLSEGVSDSTERSKLLVMALGGLVEAWNGLSAQDGGVLSSPQNLLQASFNNGAGGGLGGVITLANSILTATKKSAPPSLPDEVWTQATPYSIAQIASVHPLTPVWEQVLPGVICAVRAMHAVWGQAFREQGGLAAQDAALLYTPSAVEMSRWCGGGAGGGSGSPAGDATTLQLQAQPEGALQAVRREMLELRSSLYQMLGQACTQKVLYASPDLGALLADCSASLAAMENTHVAMLTARFFEPFVLNAPPFVYPAIADFVALYLQSSLARLAVAWDRSPNQQMSPEHQMYRLCGLPAGSACAPFSVEQVDVARDKIVGDCTKCFAELAGSLGLVRGFLIDGPTAAGAAAVTATATATGAAFDLGSGSLDDKDGQPRERQKGVRRAAVTYLVMGRSGVSGGGNDNGNGAAPPSATPVTKPFVESIVALLCIPDANACKMGVLLAKSLTEQVSSDPRLLAVVGRDAFSAALLVLLRAEPFSASLEMNVLEFLLDCYCGLVLGFPVGAAATDSAIAAAASAAHAGTLRGVCSLPREVLLQVPGNTPEAVHALEGQIVTAKSKRKRRDVFRDHITALREMLKGQDQVSGGGPDLRVLDIRSKFIAGTRAKAGGAAVADAFDISALFT
jgi:hypothetical protein